MKKIISVLLAVILVVACIPFAVSAEKELKSTYPTIYFRGNSESIFDEDGNQVYDFDFDKSLVPDMVKKIVPLLALGYATNDFEEYYKVFGEEIAKLYDRCALDENGDPKYGTGIHPNEVKNNYNRSHTNAGTADGFAFDFYLFANDWRLDPLATADDIDAYIDNVLKVTGKDKVNLMCKCLGGDLILAYLAKFGTEKINAVGFGSTVAFGGSWCNDLFSGKVLITPETIERFFADDFISENVPETMVVALQIINDSISLARATGVLGFVTDTLMEKLYKRLYKGLVPELVLASYGTWPGYWTMVAADNYACARNMVFGSEGSEKYEKYKGLIEKLDNYDKQVRQRIPELLKKAEADGVRIAIVSKYGFQLPPVLESADEQSDIWTSVKYSSLGATVSKVGKTLSNSYINERIEKGFEKYISPDRQVDASTCVFPDNTWFIKNAMHNDWTREEDRILVSVFNTEGANVESFERFPQFTVYDRETDTVTPMTEENSKTESYDVNPMPKSKFDTLFVFFKWLATVLQMLAGRIFGK